MGKRRRRRKGWFSRESALEEVRPQATAETPQGVEAECAHAAPDEIRIERAAEAPEAGVEAPPVAKAPDEGEPQSAAPEREEVEVPVSVGAADQVEVQFSTEAAKEIPPQRSSDAPEVMAQFLAEAPREIEAQAAPESPPELEILLTPEEEAALRDQRVATRRQYARFVGGKATGRVTAIYDALVLDISIGGSLIEHAHVVRPGTLSSLDLNLPGKRVRLRCRVARSVVHRSEVLPNGERQLIFHTGLEFLEPSDETRRMIGDYIRTIVKERRSS